MMRILFIFVAAFLMAGGLVSAYEMDLQERYSGGLSCAGGNEKVNVRLLYSNGRKTAEGQVDYTQDGRRGSRLLTLRSSDGLNFSASGQYAAQGLFVFERLGNGRLSFDSPASYCPGKASLELDRSSVDLSKITPRDWVGKSPDAEINGKTFWDILQMTTDPATLDEFGSDWSAMRVGCTYQAVDVFNYKNDGIGQYGRLIFSTKGTCDDGRQTTVYSAMTSPAIMNAAMKDHELNWYGRSCSATPVDQSYQHCEASSDGFTCSVADRTDTYDCHSPAPIIERYYDYQRQLQTDRSCRQQWNSCANPVARPLGSTFSACYGASGAYETVCSGGAQDARLLGRPIELSLPVGLSGLGAPSEISSKPDTIEVLDAATGTMVTIPNTVRLGNTLGIDEDLTHALNYQTLNFNGDGEGSGDLPSPFKNVRIELKEHIIVDPRGSLLLGTYRGFLDFRITGQTKFGRFDCRARAPVLTSGLNMDLAEFKTLKSLPCPVQLINVPSAKSYKFKARAPSLDMFLTDVDFTALQHLTNVEMRANWTYHKL